MRNAILIAVLLSPVAARAESLTVDDELLRDAASLLAGQTHASSTLPALLQLAEVMNGAPKSGAVGFP